MPLGFSASESLESIECFSAESFLTTFTSAFTTSTASIHASTATALFFHLFEEVRANIWLGLEVRDLVDDSMEAGGRRADSGAWAQARARASVVSTMVASTWMIFWACCPRT